MASRLRLNVVSISRDKRFLVLADDDWLLEDLKTCIGLVFHKLYPDEETMQICKLQNEFHFDLPLDYAVGDTLTDSGLIFAIEDESRVNRSSDLLCVSPPISEEMPSKPKKTLKRKRKGKTTKKYTKSKSASGNDAGCTSSNAVTSTTGSPLTQIEDCSLMPQVIEHMPCEDTEVDVETLED